MHIASVNISEEKGVQKQPVDSIVVDERGIQGDAHAGDWHRQVSVLSTELIKQFSENTGRETGYGEFAENITTTGIDLSTISLLDRFSIGDVLLEVSQIGKECHGDTCSIFQEVGKCIMPKEGLFCRVLQGGELKTGDTIEHHQRKLRIAVITVSDRASRGEYEDLSGPAVVKAVKDYFQNTRWRLDIDLSVLPDEPEQLSNKLDELIEDEVDVIVTTGGTGVSPRDLTPEVVAEMCDKFIPGIMEGIRVKYGMDNPKALLSRSVAGTADQTTLYALPGSVKAVNEYMAEILKTMEHLILMLNGLGH